MTTTNNIVKAVSEGNKYNYAALSDIANQGYKLPKMKVSMNEGNEYIYYYDTELNEWVQGAKVVVPSPILNREGKASMNEAQLYGSALTYARRYTALMALQLACEDDKELESEPPKASEKQLEYIRKLYSLDSLNKMLEHYKLEKLEDMTSQIASGIISKAKDEIKKKQSTRDKQGS